MDHDDELDLFRGATAETGGLGRRSAVGVLVTTTSQGLRFLVQFGSMVLLARLLQPWQFGLVAMISPVMSLLYVFADLGLAQAIVQKPKLTATEVSSVFWIICLSTLGLAAGLASASPFIAAFYGEPRLVPILLLFSMVLAISGCSIVHRALLTREARFGLLAWIDVIAAGAGAVAGVGSALAGAGYWALVFSGAASILAATGLSWAFCDWRPRLVLRWAQARSFLGAGGYVATTNFATLLTASADNVLIGYFLGKAPLGLYDQGYRFVTQSVSQLLTPVSRVLVPLFVRARHNQDDYSPTFLATLRALCLALWPGLIVGFWHAPELVQIVLGDQWEGAAPIVSWFCLGAMASPLYNSAGWLFLAEGRLRAHSFNAILASLVTVTCVLSSLHAGVQIVARNLGLVYALIITPYLFTASTRQGPVKLQATALALLPYAAAALAVSGAFQFAPAGLRAEGVAGLLGSLALSYGVFLAMAVLSPADRKMLVALAGLRTMFRSERRLLS